MSDIKDHKRVNDILLGPLERPALQWLAAHLPAWATPDMMTVIGIIGALVITLGYGLSQFHPAFLWLATLGFIINWFGDSLDGTLARIRHIERPKYGFYIDHVTDCAHRNHHHPGSRIKPLYQFFGCQYVLHCLHRHVSPGLCAHECDGRI